MLAAASLALFPALMAYAAASDLLTMTIPNRLSFTLLAAFPVLAWTGGMGGAEMLGHLGAGALVLTACFAMFAAGWMGGGDAKLAAAVALWFGLTPVLLEYLLLAAAGGGALTLGLLAARHLPLPGFAVGWTWAARLHDRATGVPYGIALAGAALMVYPTSRIFTLIAAQ